MARFLLPFPPKMALLCIFALLVGACQEPGLTVHGGPGAGAALADAGAFAPRDAASQGMPDTFAPGLQDAATGRGEDVAVPAEPDAGGEGTPSDLPPPEEEPAIEGPSTLAYPTRTPWRIKGIQPDFWNRADIIGNNTGGVAVNTVWAAWEPSRRGADGCGGGREEAYEGHCFTIDPAVDEAIRAYSEAGVVITAVVYGVPAWAREGRTCSPVSPGFEIFCTANDAQDYARFAGFLAKRYDGTRGHGRIADFVIHNEVNSNNWFDVGCGQGVACNVDQWLDAYTSQFNAAHDAIRRHQTEAKVLISLDHHFDSTFDRPAIAEPLLSGKRVIEAVAARAAGRQWQVAFHPYPPNLLRTPFGADDLPKVTYGNIGALVGWLHQRFPDRPHAWQVMLTESGVNSISPHATEAAQAEGVCRSLRNVLGTPGIDNYIYHRMKDHPDETRAGLGLGLVRADGTYKPSWATWALSNRNDLTPPKLSCGFEELPYTRLTLSRHDTRGHWTSSRLAPAGFRTLSSWRLLREAAPGTVPLFECLAGGHNLLTRERGCEGLVPMGPVGHAWTDSGEGRVPLYRCYNPRGDHFVSTSATCGGQTMEQLLGYVLPG